MTDAAEPVSGPAGIGQRLAEARTARGLSISEAASRLRLTARQIEAIEQGDLSKLPGQTFARGFIRNYARLLGVDPEPLLRGLPAVTAALERPPPLAGPAKGIVIRQASRSQRLWYLAGVLLLIVAIPLAVYGLLHPRQEAAPGPAPWMVQGDGAAPAEPVAPSSPALSSYPAPGESTAAPGPRPAPNSPSAGLDPGLPGAQRPAAGAPSADVPAPVAANEIRLMFDNEAWVEIKDADGETVFSRLNPAGSEQTVTGKPPFSLVIGNARGVRMTYNGRPVDVKKYIKIKVARFQLE